MCPINVTNIESHSISFVIYSINFAFDIAFIKFTQRQSFCYPNISAFKVSIFKSVII
jgi:hypothetical protein